MRWECPECGDTVDRTHAPPACCPTCGTAVTLTRADATDLPHGDDSLRAAWIRAGMERGFLRAT